MSDEVARAIEDVYRRRYPAFLSAAACVTGDPQSAHDAVQDAFAQALRRRDTFRDQGRLEGWLWRITFRAALRQRRNGRELTLAEALLEASIPGETLDPELVAALRALPPRRRLIVFLRYFADLPYDEIAAICGIRVGTVGAALTQAHTELLTTLDEKGASR